MKEIGNDATGHCLDELVNWVNTRGECGRSSREKRASVSNNNNENKKKIQKKKKKLKKKKEQKSLKRKRGSRKKREAKGHDRNLRHPVIVDAKEKKSAKLTIIII